MDTSAKQLSANETASMCTAWKKDAAFVCKECGGPSYQEQKEPKRWGCPSCSFATFSPSACFKEYAAA